MPAGVSLSVGGTVDDSLAAATWVEVHERLGRPTVYRIRFEVESRDGDLTYLADDRLAPGSELGVLVPGVTGNDCLVTGPVGSHRVHLENGGSGSYVEVRGSDACAGMDHEARSAIWTDLTDSDAVTSVVSSYGLTPDVESTSARHDETAHPLVQRESDLSFVRRLARRNGYAFWVTSDGGVATAHFRSLPVGDQPAATLTVNRAPPHLDGLDLTWDTERPTSVEALQVDLLTKEDIDGAAPEPPLTSLGKDDLASITGDTRSMYLAAPVDDAGDLRARADAALVESSFFVRATGSTTRERVGRPVRAHTVVGIDGAGSRHSGSYLVAAVRHTVDESGHRMDLELLRNGWGS